MLRGATGASSQLSVIYGRADGRRNIYVEVVSLSKGKRPFYSEKKVIGLSGYLFIFSLRVQKLKVPVRTYFASVQRNTVCASLNLILSYVETVKVC